MDVQAQPHSRARSTHLQEALLAILGVVLLAACSLAPAALPTPATASPCPSLGTPEVPPTATPAPTPVPTLTATPAPTPVPTPTATATPSPPPLGDSTVLERAAALMADGDYEGALRLYQELRAGETGTVAADEALLGLAQAYLGLGQPLSATMVLSPSLELLAAEPRHRAHYLLAEALDQAGDCPRAVPLYQRYREEGTALEDLVAERLAWCYRSLGDSAHAAVEFTRAAGPYRSVSNQVTMLEEAATDLRAIASYDEALARYDSILELASKAWYRASILYQAGETLQAAGRPLDAQARWQELLDLYPETEVAAQAADTLIAAAAQVDPYHVGQAFLAAGRPEEAVGWLEEALRQQSPDPEARYTLAWARSAAGDLDGALAELDTLAEADPTDPRPLQEQASLLEQAGALSRAVETYNLLVERFPESSTALNALWQAGQRLEELGRTEEALATYTALFEGFPAQERAADARFRAGLLCYRQGRFADAAALWTGVSGGGATRLALWRGLALDQAGRAEEARQAWEEAAAGDGYYAARAHELLSAAEGFGEFHRWPVWGYETAARAEAEKWLARAWGQPVSATLPPRVRGNPLFVRGEELLALGCADLARQPFALLVDRFHYDGPALYALSLYLRQHGLHALSVLAADPIVQMVAPDWHSAPEFLMRLRYPTPYAHLIVPQAMAQEMDPMLFFALVRQESLFDRYATSSANARGLTQVIPSTGEGIAAALGFSPFRLEDLYRPAVSVRFGTWYMGAQLRAFEGQAVLALAAYNGGPGNARRWAGGVVPVADTDLFVETIDYTETRDYIERIYTSYWIYRQLYPYASAGPTR